MAEKIHAMTCVACGNEVSGPNKASVKKTALAHTIKKGPHHLFKSGSKE